MAADAAAAAAVQTPDLFDEPSQPSEEPEYLSRHSTNPPVISFSPDDPVVDAARNALELGVEGLRFCEQASIAGEIEAIHQIRVTTRRLRAAVELFAGVLHGSRVRIYRRDLPWIGRTAGSVRECDVIEGLIRNRATKLDLSWSQSLSPIYEALSARRRAEHARVIEMIKSPLYRRLTERLSHPLVRKIPSAVTVCMLAPAMMRPIIRAATRAGARLAPDSNAESFHHLRIRLKRLRYSLEMLEGLGGKRSCKALNRLRDLQEILGMHQDAVGAITWLRQFATNGAPPEVLLAAGAIVQSLMKRREKLAARGYKGWKRLADSGIIQAALAELARNARSRTSGQMQTVTAG